MDRAPATTLYVLPASQSPLALVIRRGPTKCWHFLLWDRMSGAIAPGSWFSGMVYPHRCDLSPRGDWMVLLAYRGGVVKPYAWTALCRPPAVKAVAFWPQDSGRVGGGFFDPRSPIAWMNVPADAPAPELKGKHPFEFGFQESPAAVFGGAAERLERDGWRPLGPAGLDWRKPSPGRDFELRLLLPAARTGGPPELSVLDGAGAQYSLYDTKSRVALPFDATWANWNARGELCLARGGALFTAHPTAIAGEWSLVSDLNGLVPRAGAGAGQGLRATG